MSYPSPFYGSSRVISSRFKGKKLLMYGAFAFVVVGVFVYIGFLRTPPEESVSVQFEGETPSVIEKIPELPVRLIIPAIGVNALVQYVGLDKNNTGAMGVPSNFTDVGWYKGVER